MDSMKYSELKRDIKNISLAMFRKDYMGIFHGSISSKIEENQFLINKKHAIFDDLKEEHLIKLYFHKDYRWKDASLDASIHMSIYDNIHEAKYIAYTMPPTVMAWCEYNDYIKPIDYFGQSLLGLEGIKIYSPKEFSDWYDRSPVEITNYLKKNKTDIVVIKGYGIYAYDRDIYELSKKIAVISKSCQILLLSRQTNKS
jgi:L-fuculose-phosphate aldolase